MTSIEDELKRFYASGAPSVDTSKKLQVVELVAREARKASLAPTYEAMSFRRFVLAQMRFINCILGEIEPKKYGKISIRNKALKSGADGE